MRNSFYCFATPQSITSRGIINSIIVSHGRWNKIWKQKYNWNYITLPVDNTRNNFNVRYIRLHGYMSCFHHIRSITRNIHMACTGILLRFCTSQFYPYPSGLLHWHWGNHVTVPVPVKQPLRIWVNISLDEQDLMIHLQWNKIEQHPGHIPWQILYVISNKWTNKIWKEKSQIYNSPEFADLRCWVGH